MVILKRDIGNKKSKKLVCAFNFPPYNDTSSNVAAKRLFEAGEKFDVIHNKMIYPIDNDFNNIIKTLINNDVLLDIPPWWRWENARTFVKEGMEEINKICEQNGEYERVYSRSMQPMSHFLAFAYKIKNPDVEWTVEFSDPLMINSRGETTYIQIPEKDMEKINKIIKEYDYPVVDNDNFIFYSEYLPFLFADKILFTNQSGMELMLNTLKVDEIKEDIIKKSEIAPHPIPPKEWYYLKESNYDKIDDGKVNIAYFGKFFDLRHIYNVFSSFYALDKDLQEKTILHLFVQTPEEFQKIIDCTPIKDNIIVNPFTPLLEFLNLTTKFDCLIVNDLKSKGNFERNPFVPSKISDYMGSGTDIWRICEKNSQMTKIETKYISYIENIFSVQKTLEEIIKDNIKKKFLD